MKSPLTIEEENLVKDLLKHIAVDDDFNKDMEKAVNMPVEQFDALADSIFKKLQNGRVTVTEH